MSHYSAARADLEDAVRAGIARVEDPCSIAANAPLNLFELGLVRDWSISDDGDVTVSISPTAPSCVLIGGMKASLEQYLSDIDGIRSVRVDIETSTIWSTELMSTEGRHKLDQRRQRSFHEVPVRPRQWQETSAPDPARPDAEPSGTSWG